jgi:RHH-type rel operon transcriptional repressor/antitoxin RelB
MATSNQRSHPSGQIVSVRLPPDVIKRIDALAEHTGRSRGLYIRLALSAFLPQLEEDHWNQKTASYDQRRLRRVSCNSTSSAGSGRKSIAVIPQCSH